MLVVCLFEDRNPFFYTDVISVKFQNIFAFAEQDGLIKISTATEIGFILVEGNGKCSSILSIRFDFFVDDFPRMICGVIV